MSPDIGQQLADGRASAGVIDGRGVAGLVPPLVGQAAGVGIAAEEGPDVPLESDRQGRYRRTAPEPAQGQVDEQVLGAAPGDRIPLVGAGDPLDQGEGGPLGVSGSRVFDRL